MIFGSGFDVLRSEKSQVEKFLPFTVLPKLRIGSNLTQTCMFKGWWECLKTFGIVCWYLVVSFLFFCCLEGCFIWYGWYFGMSQLLGGVWDSLHEGFSLTGANSPIWPNPEKQDVLSPDSFEASKYQNLPICHFQKWLSFAIFLIFHVCQREITIYSLFGSPCSIS